MTFSSAACRVQLCQMFFGFIEEFWNVVESFWAGGFGRFFDAERGKILICLVFY